jgi:UDP-sugar transporter A1/2/3
MSSYGKVQQMEPDEEDASTPLKEPNSSTPLTPSGAPSATPAIEEPKTRFGVKMLILCSVTLQNTSYALVRRYSRGFLQEKYSTSSALLMMELTKLLFSAVMLLRSGDPSDVPAGSAVSKWCFLLRHSAKMTVPAVIYLVMNILGFMALQHLDASTFSIIAQMKVFTTATFSVLMLNRQLAYRKWRALLTLTLGVILISHEALPKEQDAAKRELAMMEYFLGMAASLGDVILSGFVSIYFEKVLKSKAETYSVWDRNFQMAFWSAAVYLPIMYYEHPHAPLRGWSWVTVGCAACGALGGVLVALSIKHTDSIMKTIATTGSIVLTTILNASFLGGPFNLPILTGGLVVIVSVFNYNDKGDPQES